MARRQTGAESFSRYVLKFAGYRRLRPLQNPPRASVMVLTTMTLCMLSCSGVHIFAAERWTRRGATMRMHWNSTATKGKQQPSNAEQTLTMSTGIPCLWFECADFYLVGYSCLPLLLVILLGTSLLLIALGLGFRKLHGCIPVVGSCSVAISAACHRPKEDIDASVLPVNWGAVSRHRCCFTSQKVHDLVSGRPHAGENVELGERGAVGRRLSE